MGTLVSTLRLRHIAAVSALITVLAGCGGQESGGEQGGQGQPQAAAVGYVTVGSERLELTDTLPGRVSAYRIAEIRPQVNGIILERFFEEGAAVKEGDKLYQIDPTLYKANVESAKAQLAVAKANAYAANLTAKRYKELSKKSAISDQEVDDSEANAKQADAQVKAAEAALRTAEVNLSYTEIRAPISGIIGRSTITEGALVSAQQATQLTVIRQLKPVYVDIKRPAASLIRMKNPDLSRDVTVELDDGTPFAETGKLQFSDVSVDEGTGSVNVRVLFDNADGTLLPGMFVRAQVPSALIEEAILAPQAAVVRQATGETVVYLVTEDNTAVVHNVKVTRAIGDKWLVQSGLSNGDRIIVSGLQAVQSAQRMGPPGAPVAVNPEEATR
ncbi:MAG: efflux transporter periplasmic adaptor subunit [Oceanospirillaceae bacterium]|uniref:efflux RND transporter periplasmic adaptor subunit n=1 Tax=unclassified Thalassolituus TaxID=2624967 RepID=UPI000C0B757E|nr:MULTISPECIES: efflux RND transporter periplasmic adaptor subunit [unclassified Thalassolituus]MAK90507.1 efflux transporter periplasmic adaptor subunit [Thalassolituus sp.]MAS25568.1 efflux transporter periplasmic adaptor subunit [Oceanospirillaceae bacterium]MAY00581.1 efflux transporter periplasmic adaptor subunit [Oceanospirillaceae bacterium]MBL35271.1 efflux transporter periplasmic adaptor subunit [Oceanospirillaceae bacterium]MBS54610.1 efflux transporter periplasmic adaptor subunit [|tara:strand:- start:193 stop:1353 length:1161 start_codon:yes stop_codon:yes gene_type:complete